jgi:hypothetical protein
LIASTLDLSAISGFICHFWIYLPFLDLSAIQSLLVSPLAYSPTSATSYVALFLHASIPRAAGFLK